jgi:hypothetical protein
MYMAKYLPQPTHPSLSPGSDPMPDFCVGKHTVGRKDAVRKYDDISPENMMIFRQKI